MSIHVFQDRGVVQIIGEEAADFLNSILPVDVTGLGVGQAKVTALLSPQGKFLADFFIIRAESQTFYLDVHDKFRTQVLQRLQMYKLRRSVQLADVSQEWCCAAGWDTPKPINPLGFVYDDPRHAPLGWRGILKRPYESTVDLSTYQVHRLRLGVADGAYDLVPDKSIILEYGYDEWGAIAWDKGCYVGQELMSRTKFRGVVRKGVRPVNSIQGTSLPEVGTPITFNGEEIGELRSSHGNLGLALLRLDLLPQDPNAELLCGDIPLKLTSNS